MDIKIDSNSDIVIENGDFVFVDKIDAIAQSVRMRLATWLGESPFDKNAGVPYLTIIFQPNTPLDSVQFILEQVVLNTPGVTSVEIELDLDRQSRVLTVTGKGVALNQNFDFDITVQQDAT